MKALEVVEKLAALDLHVTGTDRGRLLLRLADEYPDSLRVVIEAEEIAGFLLARPGSKARRIGPCIAGERAGPLLLDDARRMYAGEASHPRYSHRQCARRGAGRILGPGRDRAS